MLLLSFLVFIYYIKKINILFWIGWLELDWKVSFIQILFLFFSWRLFFLKNNYQLVGYSFLWIFNAAIYLFFLQLDVFACFLLVSESIVMLFVLTMLIHFNVNNLKNIFFKKNIIFLVIIILIVFFFINTWKVNYYNYYFDWYSSIHNNYNDLVSQYIYFYKNKYLLILIGLWLLVLTFLLVNIVISCFSINLENKSEKQSYTNYTRKTQNIWKQWYTKPIIRFFN